MEQTFMTIHNLSPDANILFASESVIDILGYQPQDVQGKSCFDYFHPDEVPFARSVHSRGVLLDKAAVLHYARIKARDGTWIGCECCFTVVHDVLVACTSVYRRGARSERRAIEAPQIRRIFSSSPRDPRYHMLEHLSPKFKMQPMEREPRAALILNRFTRTLTIMFATNAVSTILGVRPDQVQDKSFYECIAENCLADAIKCLESAKANDSIAYLRFWYRDPRRAEDFAAEEDQDEGEEDGAMRGGQNGTPTSSDSTDSDGGVYLDDAMDVDPDTTVTSSEIKTEATSPEPSKAAIPTAVRPPAATASSSASAAGPSQAWPPPARAGDLPRANRRSPAAQQLEGRRRRRRPIPTFELEAVVSCTSDGLVVVLRKARPPIPSLHPPLLPVDYENGLFAAPWSEQPIRPHFHNYPPEMFYTFRPPLLPQFMPLRGEPHVKAGGYGGGGGGGGPPMDQLMKSIRDVAVFAWALVGINGNLAAYGRGTPRDESTPADGLPIWDPGAPATSYLGPEPPATATGKRWGGGRHLAESERAAAPPTAPGPLLPGSSAAEGPPGYDRVWGGGFDSGTGTGAGHATGPTPWPGATPYATEAQTQQPPAYQQHSHHSHHHHHHHHHHTHPHPPEPWTEPTAYGQHEASGHPPPTTQAGAGGAGAGAGFGNTPFDSRHLWR
ncbi:hypothetical protein GGR56DRAFT_663588 [Xylariaceae sp. FL0804]|nr:hypothetical protein GGR56DRAFT_663588 [Xylariaceae sp. FL0804]